MGSEKAVDSSKTYNQLLKGINLLIKQINAPLKRFSYHNGKLIHHRIFYANSRAKEQLILFLVDVDAFCQSTQIENPVIQKHLKELLELFFHLKPNPLLAKLQCDRQFKKNFRHYFRKELSWDKYSYDANNPKSGVQLPKSISSRNRSISAKHINKSSNTVYTSHFISVPTYTNPIHVLTDPIRDNLPAKLINRSKNFKRRKIKLPKVDIVLISHRHREYACKIALEYLIKQQPLLILPEKDKSLFEALGFMHIVELKWGERISVGDENNNVLNITAVPAKHVVVREACFSCNGYILQSENMLNDLYFSGNSEPLQKEIRLPILSRFNITI